MTWWKKANMDGISLLVAANESLPMSYTPNPIDVSGVTLAPEIQSLTEFLAENAHAHWSRQRFADGWRYGPRRDDAKKEHPGLVPYAELSESEKEYDRLTAMETLKAILALGYCIDKEN